VKHSSGQLLRTNDQQIDMNVINYIKSPFKNLSWIANETAEAAGLSGT
jgi:hypothetical protein